MTSLEISRAIRALKQPQMMFEISQHSRTFSFILWIEGFIVLLLSFVISSSFAEEPSISSENSNEDTPEESNEQAKEEASAEIEKIQLPSGSDEIIVYGQREVERLRKILDQNLQNDGYRDGKRKVDKVFYSNETIWKQYVFVYDPAGLDEKNPPRFEPWVKGHPDNKWRYISCVPPFTPMCARQGLVNH